MAQEVKGEKFSDLNKNPVDNALFLYSSDIVSPEEGAKLYLEGFRVKALENEKEVPFESISIMVPSDRGE
ncbi:hypothetical protein IJ556_00210 [bacterium]|nr:hypothetical protein [bacterium]